MHLFMAFCSRQTPESFWVTCSGHHCNMPPIIVCPNGDLSPNFVKSWIEPQFDWALLSLASLQFLYWIQVLFPWILPWGLHEWMSLHFCVHALLSGPRCHFSTNIQFSFKTFQSSCVHYLISNFFRFKDPGDTVHVHSDLASMRELAYLLEGPG